MRLEHFNKAILRTWLEFMSVSPKRRGISRGSGLLPCVIGLFHRGLTAMCDSGSSILFYQAPLVSFEDRDSMSMDMTEHRGCLLHLWSINDGIHKRKRRKRKVYLLNSCIQTRKWENTRKHMHFHFCRGHTVYCYRSLSWDNTIIYSDIIFVCKVLHGLAPPPFKRLRSN